jgi:threonine dehydrogenase-like Zn-dependent dehydrogenase
MHCEGPVFLPSHNTALVAAAGALMGFWFTKLAVGIALIAVKHLLMGEVLAPVLTIAVIGAGAVGLAATQTAAAQIIAAIRSRQ